MARTPRDGNQLILIDLFAAFDTLAKRLVAEITFVQVLSVDIFIEEEVHVICRTCLDFIAYVRMVAELGTRLH